MKPPRILSTSSTPNQEKVKAIKYRANNKKSFCGHQLFGFYSVAHEQGITTFFSTKEVEITNDLDQYKSSLATIAERFIASNAASLRKVNNEIY